MLMTPTAWEPHNGRAKRKEKKAGVGKPFSCSQMVVQIPRVVTMKTPAMILYSLIPRAEQHSDHENASHDLLPSYVLVWWFSVSRSRPNFCWVLVLVLPGSQETFWVTCLVPFSNTVA